MGILQQCSQDASTLGKGGVRPFHLGFGGLGDYTVNAIWRDRVHEPKQLSRRWAVRLYSRTSVHLFNLLATIYAV